MVSSAAKQAITAATWEVSGALGGEQHDAEARTGTDPFPRCCFGKESTCDRANSGTEEGSGGENAHGQSTLIGREPGEDQHSEFLAAHKTAERVGRRKEPTSHSHVGDDASSRGERTGAEHPSKETQDKQRVERLGAADPRIERGEREVGEDEHLSTPKDLRARSP